MEKKLWWERLFPFPLRQLGFITVFNWCWFWPITSNLERDSNGDLKDLSVKAVFFSTNKWKLERREEVTLVSRTFDTRHLLFITSQKHLAGCCVLLSPASIILSQFSGFYGYSKLSMQTSNFNAKIHIWVRTCHICVSQSMFSQSVCFPALSTDLIFS